MQAREDVNLVSLNRRHRFRMTVRTHETLNPKPSTPKPHLSVPLEGFMLQHLPTKSRSCISTLRGLQEGFGSVWGLGTASPPRAPAAIACHAPAHGQGVPVGRGLAPNMTQIDRPFWGGLGVCRSMPKPRGSFSFPKPTLTP